MIFPFLSLAAVALAATETCNPLKLSNCEAETALGTDATFDFKSESDMWEVSAIPSGVSYTDEGLELTIKKQLDNPGIKSKFTIMFGRVEAHMKVSEGTGIVSSFFLQSDALDEIDVELVGGDTSNWQSNYFYQGKTETWDRGAYHATSKAPQSYFANYTIVWTDEKVEWWFDGTLARTLTPDNSQGMPQTPMHIFFGIWAGGDSSNPAGTIEWAGGATDYSKVPFTMYVKKLIVSDYSSGTSYSYGDQTGSWKSIKAEDGEVLGRLDSANIDESSASASPSSSSSSESSSSAPSEASSSSVVSSESSSSSSESSSSSLKTSSTRTSSSSASPSPSKTSSTRASSSSASPSPSKTSTSSLSSSKAETTKASSTTTTSETPVPTTVSSSAASSTSSHTVSSQVNGAPRLHINTLIVFFFSFVLSTY